MLNSHANSSSHTVIPSPHLPNRTVCKPVCLFLPLAKDLRKNWEFCIWEKNAARSDLREFSQQPGRYFQCQGMRRCSSPRRTGPNIGLVLRCFEARCIENQSLRCHSDVTPMSPRCHSDVTPMLRSEPRSGTDMRLVLFGRPVFRPPQLQYNTRLPLQMSPSVTLRCSADSHTG